MKPAAVLAAALFLSATAHASDLDALAAKVVDAYGGAAAWSKVTRIDATGRVEPAMRSGNGTMTRTWSGNDNLRVEITYADRKEVRALENGAGTNNGRASNAMELAAMKLQAARIALPQLLVQHKSALRAAGANGIEIPLDGGLTVTIEVDPATGHIVRSTGRSGEMAFATAYSDYRKVAGLLVAFHEENNAMGMKTADIVLDKVEIK